jgi:hypothetical protein
LISFWRVQAGTIVIDTAIEETPEMKASRGYNYAMFQCCEHNMFFSYGSSVCSTKECFRDAPMFEALLWMKKHQVNRATSYAL